MDWLTFIVELVGAIAWPLVVVTAVVLLRRSIAILLLNLRSAKYKDLELQFGEKLDELESQAEKADLPEPVERPAGVFETPDEWTFGDYIERLAPISPRMAIAEAWRHVELALRDAALKGGQRVPRDLMTIADQLQSRDILPRDAVSLLRDLRPLRNQAIHAGDFDLEPDQAIEFARLSERIIASIRRSEDTA